MEKLEKDRYLTLRSGARIIEADRFGEKVLELRDGTYLKLFRRKRLLSSSAWYPYAQRFADNSASLEYIGIPCPRIIGVYRIPSISRDAVHYHPLTGKTIRQRVAASLDDEAADLLREQIGIFVAKLHSLGAYFRSLHLGNIVQTPEGALGLIDIADLRIRGKALGNSHRRRNIGHLTRYDSDARWLFCGPAFQNGYDAEAARRMEITMKTGPLPEDN